MRWTWVACVAGCTGSGLDGDWTVALRCGEVEGVPACPGTSVSLIRVDSGDGAFDGTHRTLFPGFTEPDGSYSGVTGPLVVDVVEAQAELRLTTNVDDPLASEADLEAWDGRVLRLTGQPGTRCWKANWVWEGGGASLASGDADVSRPDRSCD